ncbi:MAG: hypothetical protein LBK76_09985 [Verrucomicrobiales bacterium]|jgi:hypothetical protein|nr:hypothetical protein [Verrucomicrobiales bacterium]
MNFLTALFTAVGSFFGWRTKTARAPVQTETQQARKGRDGNKDFIDDWMSKKKDNK